MLHPIMYKGKLIRFDDQTNQFSVYSEEYPESSYRWKSLEEVQDYLDKKEDK